ncbi:hypothetical protein ACQPZJ_35535 [Actinoplanes sp. CA-054009]
MTAPVGRKHETREGWLHEAIQIFRPWFEDVSLPIPETLHVSIGFSWGARAEGRIIQGQCWSRNASQDMVNHIFISPEMGDPMKVLMVLVHELCHAGTDCNGGHGGEFLRAMKELGMRKPFTDSLATEEFTGRLKAVAEALGPYPHGAFIARGYLTGEPAPEEVGDPGREDDGQEEEEIKASGPKPQKARMIKAVCATEGCKCTQRTETKNGEVKVERFLIYVTSRWIEVGNARCPFGGEIVPAV